MKPEVVKFTELADAIFENVWRTLSGRLVGETVRFEAMSREGIGFHDHFIVLSDLEFPSKFRIADTEGNRAGRYTRSGMLPSGYAESLYTRFTG